MNIFKNVLSLCLIITGSAFAQENSVTQNLLFDDSDIIVRADIVTQPANNIDENAKTQAANSAKALLEQRPKRLIAEDMPAPKTQPSRSTSKVREKPTIPAPFGLLWNSSVITTRDQGVQLNLVEIKDYPNSFQATHLPKAIDFFTKVYVTYGTTDELYRIIAHSKFIDDDSSASVALGYYKTYSEYLNKKYGNMQQNYTPATITKTSTDSNGKEITTSEPAPIGNPDFLSQLSNGTAVLYSTYRNEQVEATLSIGVDGNQKSYIVIEYRNLQILKQIENSTIDAL